MLQKTPNARSASTRRDRQRERRILSQTVRGAISCMVDEFRALDRRIKPLVDKMPDEGDSFDVLTELGAGLRCVRHELLADAIETLDALATFDDEALRQRYEERQAWMVAEGE